MPRGKLSKDELKHRIFKLKNRLHNEHINFDNDPKWLANTYLNSVLDIIEEYRE